MRALPPRPALLSRRCRDCPPSMIPRKIFFCDIGTQLRVEVGPSLPSTILLMALRSILLKSPSLTCGLANPCAHLLRYFESSGIVKLSGSAAETMSPALIYLWQLRKQTWLSRSQVAPRSPFHVLQILKISSFSHPAALPLLPTVSTCQLPPPPSCVRRALTSSGLF